MTTFSVEERARLLAQQPAIARGDRGRDRGGAGLGGALHLRTATMMAAALAVSACGQAATSSRGSPDRLALLFDPNAKPLPIPIGEGAAKVCAASPGLMALYAGRGVSAVTGAVPFSPARDGDSCHVEIALAPPVSGDLLFQSASCQIHAVTGNRIRISVPPARQDEEFAAAECFYRLALVAEGFSNGFAAPIFGEYPSNVFFVGKRSYVGEIVTPVVSELIWRCHDLPTRYYRSDLKEHVRLCEEAGPIKLGPVKR